MFTPQDHFALASLTAKYGIFAILEAMVNISWAEVERYNDEYKDDLADAWSDDAAKLETLVNGWNN